MKQIFFFLLCHFYGISKLIGSNTLQEISSIWLHDQDINLTVWILPRFPIKFEDQKLLECLQIIDQNYNHQVVIYLAIFDENLMGLYFQLQNKYVQTKEIKRENNKIWELEWDKISINREICFNQLQYSDTNISVTCDNYFNATLFIVQSIFYHIYVYDQDEIENQEIILSNLFLIENEYYIITQKNDLVINFYAKFYCCRQETKIFFQLELKNNFYLYCQSNSTQIEILIGDYNDEKYKIKKLDIYSDQWMLFRMEFDQLDIIIQYNINNTNNKFVVQIDHYLDVTDYFILNFQFKTQIMVKNSNTTYIQYLQIISLIASQNHNSCNKNCQFCLYSKCLDKNNTLDSFNIANQIKSSIYYNENYFKNYKLEYNDQKNEVPKYQRKYCYNCNILQRSIIYLDDYSYLGIKTNSYDYYLENLYEAPKEKQENNGLFFEMDLNLYIMKSRDIYLTYYLSNQNYCENGYQFKHKCEKILKNQLQIQFSSFFICQYSYALFKNKCIRCQKNCQFCKIIRKKIVCILNVNNYYQNSQGLIKQCTNNSQILNCLPKEQAINEFLQKGHQVCQPHQVFDIKQKKCLVIYYYQQIFTYLQYYPITNKYQEQYLDIQDIIEESNLMNEEIQGLISLQQVNKLSELVQQWNKNQSLLHMNKNFQLLTQMNCQVEDLAIKNIILHDVKIYIQDDPIIIYENKHYKNLTDIYDQLLIKPKIIQFNIIIILHIIEQNSIIEFIIEKEKFKRVNLILNITFDFNPTILFKYSNQLIFTANEIIIHNLFFYQVMKNFDDSFEQTLLYQPVFSLNSHRISIYNIIIQNIELEYLFYICNNGNLRIYNIQITNSSIYEFIKGFRILEIQQFVEIYDIYCQRSNLQNFLQILSVQIINLKNIIYVSTNIIGYNFDFSKAENYIKIQNLQLINVSLSNSDFMLTHDKKNQKVANIIISNLYVQDINLINSRFFLLLNLNSILITETYWYSITMEKSNFIDIKYIVKAQIKNFYIYKLTVQNYLGLIQIQQYGLSILQDFYINCYESSNSLLISLYGDTTQVQNLNLYQASLEESIILQIHSNETEILKFMIYNSICVRQEWPTIQVRQYDKLIISGMVINSVIINENQLLRIFTFKQCLFRYLYLQDLNVTAQNHNHLIQFENNFTNNIMKYIHMRSISIYAQNKNYTILQFSKINNNKFLISQIYVKNIKNKSPENEINIIQAELYQMEIKYMMISSTHFINLIYSRSSILALKYFLINNIFRKTIDYQSFIIHKPPPLSLYKIEQIYISHFKVNYIQGAFISVFTDNLFYATLVDLTFINQNSIYQLFLFFSQKVSNSTYLQMHRVNITNQINTQHKHLKAFIETNFDIIMITYIFVENVSKQLLRTDQSRIIYIIDVHVKQYHYNDSIILINCYQQYSVIVISRITIYNSSIYKGSAFEFILYNYYLQMDSVKFIEIHIQNSVIKLVTNFHDYIVKLRSILLEGVVSDQFLFDIKSKINYFQSSIIGGQSIQIFSSDNKKIRFISGLITDIKEKCLISQNSLIFLNQSEIVDSNIMQHQDQIIRHQSNYLGMINNFNQNIMIFLSLNEGKSLFHQMQIQENLYQAQFSQNNSYLYLPSGRDINEYQYFNYLKRQYTKIYDSISFVSLYQAQTTQCILSQNFNNQTIYKQDLVLQPGVNRINNLTFTLNPYYKDQHIELDLICNQNESKFTYRALIKTFNCQLGEFLFQDQCILCDIKQYLYSVGYNQQYCLQMDQNIIEKLNIGQIKLYKTFWRHSYANKYIEQCKNQNCLGGWQTGDHSCKIGYVGALCSECDVYNVRGQGSFGQIDNQCSLCYFDYSIYLKGLLIIIIQLLLIFVSQNTNQQLSQQFLFMRISKRSFTHILQRQNINQVSVLFKLYYNYLFTIYLLKESINFGQFVDLSLNVLYNPSFIAVPQFDCLIYSFFQFPIQYTQLVIKILLPITLLNFIVIIYGFMIKFQVKKYSIYIIIVCLLIIHQQHQQVILQSLIKLLSPIKYSSIYWTLENLNIQYYSKIHQYYLLVLIIPLIILFTIINIVILIWIKYINKRIFVHLKLSLFIYKQYKSHFYYWEYFRLAFIYLYMLILYRYENTYILFLTIIIQILSHIYRPFELQNINQIDQIIYILSLSTYIGILVHQRDDSLNKFIIIVLSNIILVKIFLNYFLHSLNIQYRQQKIQYLKQMIKYMPRLGFYINTQLYDKNEYYYNLLKQCRKQKTAMNTIIQSTVSIVSKFNPQVKIEVEMTQIQNEK